MENGIQYLKIEKERYTPKQIVNPSLNLNFEPINPSAPISGYRRSYRPETTQQETQQTPVQETVQAEAVSEQSGRGLHPGSTAGTGVGQRLPGPDPDGGHAHPHPAAEACALRRPDWNGSDSEKIYTNPQDFVKDMTAAYTKALAARGISTDYAKMLVAQDALESNWGKSSLAKSFNFGGIKAVKGSPFVEKETKEYSSKRGMYKTKSKFRKCSST